MNISTRNALEGKVLRREPGAVNTEVILSPGLDITATVIIGMD